MDDPRSLTVRDFAGPVAGTDPRDALMWPPRAADVARITAVARAHAAGTPPRVLDAGAGSGLLARLLSDAGLTVTAVDAADADGPPRETGRFFPVERVRVEDVDGPFDLAVVSWMEAGRDYRAAVAARAPAIVQAADVAGGCGVKGVTSFAPHGFTLAASWRTPSWEDVAHAWRTRGRGPGGAGLPRREGPQNVIEVWVRDPGAARKTVDAIAAAEAARVDPWEEEWARLSSGRRPPFP